MSDCIATDRPILTNRQEINTTVARFWNKISFGWSLVWGPHIHHGYYEAGETVPPIKAQERLIEQLLAVLPTPPQGSVLDVGCGMGGTSLHLADRFPVDVLGVTLSEEQVRLATRRATLLGVPRVNFRVEDALSLASIPDASMDLVWSLESCEQFYDKGLFLQQAQRVLKPGGRLLLATWCSSEAQYFKRDAQRYQKLCRAFDVPYMPTIQHYQQLLEQCGLRVTYQADWSQAVAPSWEIGVSLVKVYSWLRLLRLGGWRGLRFSRQIKLMRDAFRDGRVCYGVFVAEKLAW